MAKTITSDLPVLIVGAGPAGLALAQGFRKRQVPYRIFERDEDKSTRSQGWAVAIQQAREPMLSNIPNDLPPIETISHLHNIGLKGSIAGYDGITGEQVYSRDEGATFLRADRLKLRDWLLGHINVEWNKRYERYAEDEEGVTVYFKDGSSARGCALVGAEGYNSEVRAHLVPDARAAPSAMDTILGKLTVSRDKCETLFASMARSVGAIQIPGVFLFTGLHQVADDGRTADWYWMVFRPHRSEEDRVRSVQGWESERLYAQAVEWLRPLNPKFKHIIEWTKPGDCLVLPEFSYTWSPPESGFSTGRVTLVGDAAHKMPPLGGQGVNNAFYDTIDLCASLDGEETLAGALKAYDRKVAARGREAVENSLKWPVVDTNGQS